MKTKLNLLAFSLLLFISCKDNKEPIVIRKIPVYEKTDTMTSIKKELLTRKHDYFIIENFHNKQKDSTYIFEFVRKKNRHKDFYSYSMYIYKESNVTNLKKIMNGPGEITYQSDENDLLYTIIWENEKCCIHSYYRNKKEYEICRDSL